MGILRVNLRIRVILRTKLYGQIGTKGFTTPPRFYPSSISHQFWYFFCTLPYHFASKSPLNSAVLQPFYIDVGMGPGNQLENTSAIRALRLFRVLQAEKYVSAFSMFGEVWKEVRCSKLPTEHF